MTRVQSTVQLVILACFAIGCNCNDETKNYADGAYYYKEYGKDEDASQLFTMVGVKPSKVKPNKKSKKNKKQRKTDDKLRCKIPSRRESLDGCLRFSKIEPNFSHHPKGKGCNNNRDVPNLPLSSFFYPVERKAQLRCTSAVSVTYDLPYNSYSYSYSSNSDSNTVTSNNMNGNIVTSNNMNGNIVTSNNMNSNIVTSNNMNSNIVTSNNMNGNIVTGNNMNSNIVNSNNMNSNTVNGNTVNSNKDSYYFSEDRLMRAVGKDGPTHPSCDANATYWNELEEVIGVQRHRVCNPLASDVMPVPDYWANFTMNDAAQAVNDELPGLNQAIFIDQLVMKERWGKVTFDESVIKSLDGDRFVRGAVALSYLNTWAISEVSPYAFFLKWQNGRVRPEEVMHRVWRDSQGVQPDDEKCQEGVPSRIREGVEDLALRWNISSTDRSDATKFTAYEKGAPSHPAWPAMHSSASCSSFWLAVVLDLTDEQLDQAMRIDYAVAYSRTIAGVHYPEDNMAGLKLGKYVISRKLKTELVRKYGSNEARVQRKIERVSKRIDWEAFDERHRDDWRLLPRCDTASGLYV